MRGRLITFDGGDSGGHLDQPLALHFGSGINRREFRFVAQSSGGQIREIVAVPRSRRLGNIETRIFPAYRRMAQLSLPGATRTNLELWLVNCDEDREAAHDLIARVHYLKPPRGGLILCCGTRRKGSLSTGKNQDRSSVKLIGCAVLETLWHGNPKGRQIAAERILGRKVPRTWSRRNIVDKLRIGWISRIAVEEGFQGLGVGTALTTELCRIAPAFRFPAPRVLEVMTRAPQFEHIRYNRGQRDFLCAAGFTKVDALTSKSRSRAAKMNYYYAEV
ncbi:GNAT family N-acetyltransferase [Candidatus Binatus sp.]|uniref:GNAT family N-acetyltransferase n=1 Tax=Candidatus Binatus sp. TaxID=2811406 RepID=UPI0039C86E8F